VRGADAEQTGSAELVVVRDHGWFYAFVLGDLPPIRAAVCFDRENGVQGRDSGFMVIFADAPTPGEGDPDSLEGAGVADLGSMIDEFSELVDALGSCASVRRGLAR